MRKLNYSEFKMELLSKTADYLPEEYQMFKARTENFDEEGKEVLSFAAGKGFVMLHLATLYQEYRNSEEKNLVGFMKKKFASLLKKEGPVADQINKEGTKRAKNIVLRLINLALTDKEWLETHPHTVWNDVAVCYQINVAASEDKVCYIPISNEVAENLEKYMGIHKEDLFDLAVENMRANHLVKVKPMLEVFEEMAKEFPENTLMQAEFLEMKKNAPIEMPMYVITNPEKTYGAAGMLLPEVQEELAKKLGGDYYLIPSSVHEMLAVDAKVFEDKDMLSAITEVNDTTLLEEEILSYNAYRYDAATKTIFLVEAKEQEKEQDTEYDYELDDF